MIDRHLYAYIMGRSVTLRAGEKRLCTIRMPEEIDSAVPMGDTDNPRIAIRMTNGKAEIYDGTGAFVRRCELQRVKKRR